MHELSVAVSLIDAICDQLSALGAVRVAGVNVRIGARSGVVPAALAFAFDVAAETTAVAGARLHIEHAEGHELELTSVEVVDADENR